MYDIPKTKYECLEALRINVDVMWTVNYDELVGEEIFWLRNQEEER